MSGSPRRPSGGRAIRAWRFLGELLAAAADVRREVVVRGDLARLGVVVGLVQAQPLRRLLRRLGALDRDRGERVVQQLVVVAVGAVVRQPDRAPCSLAENRTFRPFLALSVGLGPVLGPPSGAFVIAPSAASQARSIPTIVSYSKSPCRQISWKRPACSHS